MITLVCIHVRDDIRHGISEASESLLIAVRQVGPPSFNMASLVHVSQIQVRSKAA